MVGRRDRGSKRRGYHPDEELTERVRRALSDFRKASESGSGEEVAKAYNRWHGLYRNAAKLKDIPTLQNLLHLKAPNGRARLKIRRIVKQLKREEKNKERKKQENLSSQPQPSGL